MPLKYKYMHLLTCKGRWW